MKKVGFKPVVAGNPKVLILGSMPGEESLFQHQYYAHSRNVFWEIMGRLFSFDKDVDYRDRLKHLVDNRIALWDVIGECKRSGSLDSAIKTDTILINDFGALFAEYSTIEYVFFNGRMAEKEFRKRVLPNLINLSGDVIYDLLPSTSPAYASLGKEEKFEKWSKIKSVLAL